MKGDMGLSDGEWKLMNLLWDESPRTIAQLVSALKDNTGWSKGTVFMMLSRLIEKGAVRCETGGRSKLFYSVLKKDETARFETESFLSKVYGGSLSMLVASMAGQKALDRKEIDELYEILRNAEKESKQ